jgi:type I restriction enzyme S subunit
MGEWKEYKFSDLMEIFGGGTPKTTVPEYWGGNIPWLSVQDFNNGKKYCFDAEKKITEKGLKESSTKILKKGQIIISARGTVGVISMLGRDMAFNQSNYGINANSELTENEFLYYLLKHNIANFISNSYGAVFDTITKETFDQIIVSIPEKPEQKSIASILSTLDDKIDLLHRQSKTLEALAETLFRQWFVEEGTQSILIGNVARVTTGKGLKREEFIENGEFPILGANGEIGRTNKFLYESKLILTGRVGTLGKVYSSEGKVWISDNVLIVKPIDEKFFYPIYFYLKTIDFENLNVGSTQPLVTQTEVKKIELKIPTKEHFEEFAEMCSYNFEKIKTNQIQIRTLTQLRDTLLPKLMSGEVRVIDV